MLIAPFRSAAWYKASTLGERLAQRPDRAGWAELGEQSAQAQRRLQRWRSQAPFEDEQLFAKRLASDDLSEEALRALLSEQPEQLARRLPALAWLEALERALDEPCDETQALIDQAQGQTSGFLMLAAPLVERGRARLRAALEPLATSQPGLPFSPQGSDGLLLPALLESLSMIISRTLVLELNVARMSGLLAGESGEQRFISFVERLRSPEPVLVLFEEYPVMARLLAERVDEWLATSVELFERLAHDWQSICATLYQAGQPGPLIAITSAGDRHRGGRSVHQLEFSGGYKLIYKPKSLAAEQVFQDLLAWLNQHGSQPDFRPLKLLDRGEYGWVEFVEARPCSSGDEIERFYQRQGAYLALLYALEATDFHSENLIASGEHPLLIDLEALLHPAIGEQQQAGVAGMASERMNDSVLRVGMLPQRFYAGDMYAGIDISGLGGADGQLTPQPFPYWDGSRTDQMRMLRKRLPMAGTNNRPTLAGQEVRLLDYSGAIVAGFERMYRLLVELRQELLAADGPLARFEQSELRVVFRPTQVYGLLLQESYHPDLLRDALERDRYFDRLWLGAGRRPILERLIAAERADLLRGDIPLFSVRPGQRAVWSSDGTELGELLKESGLERARRRIQQLNDEDLTRQLWFIRASLASSTSEAEGSHDAHEQIMPPERQATRDELLATASALGDRLEALALRDADEATWIGLRLEQGNAWSLASLGADLYDGSPGIALFLGYLGASTGEARYTQLARQVIDGILVHTSELEEWDAIGVFDGLGGMIYTLAHLGALWQDRGLIAHAEALAARLPALIAKDTKLDLISGVAGCAGALLSLYRCSGSEQARISALLCGERLLALAQPQQHGVGWATHVDSHGPLTGLSHGASGMAWALLELWALCGDARFRDCALAAMAYERGTLDADRHNWPDLRDFSSQGLAEVGGCRTLWCHGAPGIGLARLHALRLIDNLALREDAQIALQTTLAEGFGANFSLCHGDLGNMELLLQAAETLDEPRWRAEAERVAASVLQRSAGGWRCGVPLQVETPGLMTGLAGIGYGLLRLADPHATPAVLLLEPPVNGLLGTDAVNRHRS